MEKVIRWSTVGDPDPPYEDDGRTLEQRIAAVEEMRSNYFAMLAAKHVHIRFQRVLELVELPSG